MIRQNKKMIMGFILGAVVASAITVGAFSYTATEIGYNPKDKTWKVKTVTEAINDLKTNGMKKVCTLKKGEALQVGSIYECNPSLDGKTKYNFYVLKIDHNTVKLIMDRNITGESVFDDIPWKKAVDYFKNGVGKDLKWKVTVDLPNVQDIADVVGNTNWHFVDKDCTEYFYFDSNNGVYGKDKVVPENGLSNYRWLFNYTNDCAKWGCDASTSLNGSTTYGYWTRDVVVKQVDSLARVWTVFRDGRLSFGAVNDFNTSGVRPVIIIEKSEL